MLKITVMAFILGFSLNQGLNAQIASTSFDMGINGFYNQSPLTISRATSAIGGEFKNLRVNGQLGYFFIENACLGLRFTNEYEYFSVDAQFFNANTGTYEPLIQIAQTNIFGLYGRYYQDVSNYIAAFAHLEFGLGTNSISVTEENAQGEIEQVEYPRDIEDFGFGLGLAVRPNPNVALEISGLRRTQFESYMPSGTTTGPLQIETYLGYEARIGLRINVNFAELVQKSRDRIPEFIMD